LAKRWVKPWAVVLAELAAWRKSPVILSVVIVTVFDISKFFKVGIIDEAIGIIYHPLRHRAESWEIGSIVHSSSLTRSINQP